VIDSIYKAFENFVVEFSLRRLVGAFLLAVMGLAAFGVLDRYSPYFVMGRLERATTLLERLAALDASGQTQNVQDLRELRNGVVRQLQAAVEPKPLISSWVAEPSATVSIWKFLAGALPWLLFALFYLPSIKSDPTNRIGALGALFMGIIFGFLATVFIPDEWVSWRVLILFAVGHFVIVVVGVLFWETRRKSRLNQPAG
jgi:hypothetical protein